MATISDVLQTFGKSWMELRNEVQLYGKKYFSQLK